MRLVVPIAAICLCAQAQTAAKQAAPPPTPAGKDAPKEVPFEAKGLPPRLTPGDYQFHAKVGTVTIAAEFTGHSISTPEGILNSEDYIVVETGIYGPPEARLTLAPEDFSLRVNGKKVALPSRPFGMVFASVKDPDWDPPVPKEKDKTSLNTGGGGRGQMPDTPPAPPPVPLPIQRALHQRVQKAALPEGDRALPQAGLLFFQYRGKVQGIQSLELIYNGPAGKTTIDLQP